MSGSGPGADPLWFLVRLAREFRRGGWIFTGFHWPVVGAHLAWRLPGARFVEVFEAGATVTSAPADIPTSTTDYHQYHDNLGMAATTSDVLLGSVRRLDRVILDASNVDLRGRINSTAIGPYTRPRVRLSGGGGAPDAAAQARSLVLAVGNSDPTRLHAAVEHVTAAPGPSTTTIAITRWGVLELGADPRLVERAPGLDSVAFDRRMDELDVDVTPAVRGREISPQEREAALEVLQQAARRGYVAAARMLDDVAGDAA